MEPAAVLVAALQVHVGRPAVMGAALQDAVRRTRLEPDVEDVPAFFEFPAAAVGTGRPRRNEIGRVLLVPGVGTGGGEDLFHLVDRGRIEQRRLAFFTEKGGQRHSPVALPRDAPVGTVGDHARDAFLAPGRQPGGRFDRFQRLGAQPGRVHGDEPLRRGAVDDRFFAAPAMGVGMAERIGVEQAAVGAQVVDDALVGFEHLQPGVGTGGLVEAAVGQHRGIDVEAVGHAGVVVVLAVAGGGVHAAGALVEEDVVGVDQQRIAPMQGVTRLEAVQFASLELQQLGEGVLVEGGDGRQQGGSGDIELALHLEQGVVEVGVHGDGQVGRDGPGGGGPDEDRNRSAGVRFQLRRQFAHRELHRDRGRGVVVVFDFGFGQGGAAGKAPVDRALLAVDVSLADERIEKTDDRGLVIVVEGGVGLVPIAENAEALEVGALQVEEFFRILPAFLAHLELAHVFFAAAQLLVHLVFDGQAVTVPARHIGAVVSHPWICS